MKDILNKRKVSKLTFQILFSFVIFMSYQSVNAQTTFPTNAKDSCASIKPSGFKDDLSKITLPIPSYLGGPKTIGPFYDTESGLVYVFPFNGPDFSSSTNPSSCNFFTWAAQTFLWATSTVSDGQSVPNPLTAPSNTTPYVFNSEFFYRYSDGTLTPQSADGQANQSISAFSLRSLKSDDATVGTDSVEQAGSKQGVLISQGNNNNVSSDSSLVYYSVHTSRVMGYVAAANMATSGAYTQFPTNKTEVCKAINYGLDNGYAKTTSISTLLMLTFCATESSSALAAIKEKSPKKLPPVSIPDIEVAIDYLALTVELKASWVKSDSLKDKSKYILQKATIPTYTPSVKDAIGNKKSMTETGTEVAELAMVAMHVVGTVKGHPEMIWATIEHRDNAPQAEYSYEKTGGGTGTHSPSYSTDKAKSNWLFSDGSNSKQNKEFAATSCTAGTSICGYDSKKIDASNVLISNAWGVPSSSETAPSISSELISLNNNIFGGLTSFNATNGIANDPRENYYLSGANWGKDGAIPTTSTAFKTTEGSTYLANSTLETFEQNKGCFGCHYASTDARNKAEALTTSHIFGSITSVVKAPKKSK